MVDTGASPVNAPAATPLAPAAAQSYGGNASVKMSMVTGLLFWVIVGIWVYWTVYYREDATVFLDVSGMPSTLQGRVVYRGAPVDGVLHVRVADARSNRLISSLSVETSRGVVPSTALPSEKQAVRIDAEFRGTSQPAKDKEVAAIKGESTLYLNVSPPIARQTIYMFIAAVCGFGALLTYLITGAMGPYKAHSLFAFMYLATFLALAMPIALSFAAVQNFFLREQMEKAPIGLVLARAEGASQQQWLVNIGGKVSGGVSDGQVPASTASPGSPIAPAVPGTAAGNTPVLPSPETARPVSSTPDKDSGPRVEGGLTVPFFVVILAMFGAGVNLTRKVPQIQKTYYQFLGRAEGGLLAATGAMVAAIFRPRVVVPEEAAAEIRKELVQNIMYFAAAPFLGIAVYYLLRVLANDVSQPALVIASFATGLVSDQIVDKVIDVAQGIFKGKGAEPRTPSGDGSSRTSAKPADPAGTPASGSERPDQEP